MTCPPPLKRDSANNEGRCRGGLKSCIPVLSKHIKQRSVVVAPPPRRDAANHKGVLAGGLGWYKFEAGRRYPHFRHWPNPGKTPSAANKRRREQRYGRGWQEQVQPSQTYYTVDYNYYTRWKSGCGSNNDQARASWGSGRNSSSSRRSSSRRVAGVGLKKQTKPHESCCCVWRS